MTLSLPTTTYAQQCTCQVKYVFPVLLNQKITFLAWFYYESLPANGPKKKMAYLFVFILNALHKYFRSRSQACLFWWRQKNASIILMLVEIAMTMSVFLASECLQLIRNLPLAKAGQELKFLSLSSADTTLVWAKSQMIIDGCLYNLCIQNRSKLYIFHRFIYLSHHVPRLQHLATKTRMWLIALKTPVPIKYPLDWPL